MGREPVFRSLRKQGLRPVCRRPHRVAKDSSQHLPVADALPEQIRLRAI
jgi:hypothetical protein